MAVQIVIGTEQFSGNPANLSFSCKAPEGWRSPGRCAYFSNHRVTHSVLECGGPPPLFHEAISNGVNVNWNCYSFAVRPKGDAGGAGVDVLQKQAR
jgi:hypothetical protein